MRRFYIFKWIWTYWIQNLDSSKMDQFILHAAWTMYIIFLNDSQVIIFCPFSSKFGEIDQICSHNWIKWPRDYSSSWDVITNESELSLETGPPTQHVITINHFLFFFSNKTQYKSHTSLSLLRYHVIMLSWRWVPKNEPQWNSYYGCNEKYM